MIFPISLERYISIYLRMTPNIAVLLTDDHNPDLTNDELQFPNETAMINVIKRSNEEVHDSATINEYQKWCNVMLPHTSMLFMSTILAMS